MVRGARLRGKKVGVRVCEGIPGASETEAEEKAMQENGKLINAEELNFIA